MPFKSQAQRRKFAQLLVEGKISADTFEEWNRETGARKLPERARTTGTKKTKGTKKTTKGTKKTRRAHGSDHASGRFVSARVFRSCRRMTSSASSWTRRQPMASIVWQVAFSWVARS